MKTVNHLFAPLRRLVLNILVDQPMSNPTIEQQDAATKHFVIRIFALSLAGIIVLFAYSIIYVEQPLFNESPVDKAIFGILTLVAGQLLQILANYITKSSIPLSTPPTTTIPTCVPSPTKPSFAPQSSSPHFGNPNDRPPL